MIFFTLGYLIIWLLLLGYTAFLQRQQLHLKKQLLILEERVAKQGSAQ